MFGLLLYAPEDLYTVVLIFIATERQGVSQVTSYMFKCSNKETKIYLYTVARKGLCFWNFMFFSIHLS